ncbi:glycosyltransferase [Pseudanabaena sp. FACHB-2040]|uniref:glycosyltransferase n=1 Tax=Pseudanabaena sp. FACHB-2040 TaxID=2692859 RepID=UPI001687F1D4|nr:glycosyltransferase [Pseudanabaena sp. FACHB-2040]MBD2260581.1 glycosyltransferase [Pseudanabaena sp. FACHB-2040]
MKLFFIDQSGNLGGAELCLADIAQSFETPVLIGLLQDGPFRERLESLQVPVQVLTKQALQVRKESGLAAGLKSLQQLIPLIQKAARTAADYDAIYANTPKALVVGALASALSRRPLVYHLHDIIAPEHFSKTNRQLLIFLANRFARLVIANSNASKAAFIEAGGQADKVEVVYNGFDLDAYPVAVALEEPRAALRQELGLSNRFVVGHFSRLAPWKGQHILLEALTHLPEDVVALFVGDALFGEDAYVEALHQQVKDQGLSDRIRFLGFQSDIPRLMAACDLVAHTSTAPEPFGRVIVEAMLCARPVIAAAAGGAVELVEPGQTGWLCPPGDADKLAALILSCRDQPEFTQAVAQRADQTARQRFNLTETNQQIRSHLQALLER